MADILLNGIKKPIYARKIDVGKLNATVAVSSRMAFDMDFFRFVTKAVERFRIYDWGDLDFDDRMLNNQAVVYGGRLVGAYYHEDSTMIYIVRDADGMRTTIMMSEEY